MKEYTFCLSNGFASGNNFTTTLEDAVDTCIVTSRGMNTMNWLHIYLDDKWLCIGHSIKVDYMEWEFYQYEGINI